MAHSPTRYPLILLAGLLAMAGCKHIGPGTIVDDRLPYNEAIAHSWKQQTLLNIVRLRYSDLPEFIDVPSVVSGYEHNRTTTGNIASDIFPRNPISNVLSLALGGGRTLSDRPTVSYTPQTGSQFIRNLTNPLPPVTILNLIESGTPANIVMELAVESINGIRNRGYIGEVVKEDPEFQQIIQTMRKAQASGHVSLRIKPGTEKDKDRTYPELLMGIRDKDVPPALAAELDQMRKLLRLDPDVREFRVVFGLLPQAKDEIAFRTRSVLRIMLYLALNVHVPESHLAEGRAQALDDPGSTTQPHLTVHSGCEKPRDSFAAVCYQGHWFWIDPRDESSKRSMSYLKVLLALADTAPKEAAPALTIRAN